MTSGSQAAASDLSNSTTGSNEIVLKTSPTIVTPTVASLTNMQHNHENAAGGGQIDEDALALTNVTTNNVSTSNHGFAPILPNDATKFLDGTGNYTIPATSGGAIALPVVTWAAVNANSSTSLVVTTSTPTVGKTLIALVRGRGRAANSITQTNVAWTLLNSYNGNSEFIQVWLGVVSASPGTSATLAFTGTAANYAYIFEPVPVFTTAGTRVQSTQASNVSTDIGSQVIAAGA